MPRSVRPFVFCAWAEALEPAPAFLAQLPHANLAPRLPPGADERLQRMARLDADWHAENVRCLAHLQHPALTFLPALTLGTRGLAAFAEACRQRPTHETWWLIFTAQDPQKLGPALAPFCALIRKHGVRILFYAFDEASRTMPCFDDLAPHLDVLIHDEAPLAEAGLARLRPDCRAIHRSWVANLVPFAAPFNEAPEEKILFLGSQLGLTPHRQRQIDFLKQRFKDKFAASHDHSVSVADRLSLNRFKVGFCPEGRKFATPAMARTHTDRPFWSGCLGLIPVSENSRHGSRLDELAARDLIMRYPHGDLKALAEACERALAADTAARRRIYEHFNRHETVGQVVAKTLGA